MWSSAATRKYVENVAVEGRPKQVVLYDFTLSAWLVTAWRFKHVGKNNGKKAMVVKGINQHAEKEGTAEVAQAPTAFVLPVRVPRIRKGAELYNSPPAARAVRDTADEHVLAVHGHEGPWPTTQWTRTALSRLFLSSPARRQYSSLRFQPSQWSSPYSSITSDRSFLKQNDKQSPDS
ncbi:3-oxoacyl-[acyl-carrier-protein] synthase [Tulasnella sp. 427]|nr:3-oxoacyl-[acyl-carrier-protein] synthase [Tulasnella sp. 427]